jgi:cycloeucalenol cycloisomerase
MQSYPDYSFRKSKYMVYTLGSAFYGIYFIVSYPAFFSLDESLDCGDPDQGGDAGSHQAQERRLPHTLRQTVMEALGASMLVLCLLDFARLYLSIELKIPGILYYIYKKD